MPDFYEKAPYTAFQFVDAISFDFTKAWNLEVGSLSVLLLV